MKNSIVTLPIFATCVFSSILVGCGLEEKQNDLSNSAPLVTSVAETSAFVNQPYTYTLTATDEDEDELTFTAENLPSWLSFNTTSGLLTGTPEVSDIGTHFLSFRVTDGHASISETFEILVNDGNQASGDEFIFISADETSDLDFSTTVVNEWSTSTAIQGDFLYNSISSWAMTSGPNSPEQGNWGTVLAFAGGIDGDLSLYTTLKLKIASTGGYSSYAATISANGVTTERTLPVDDTSTDWQDITIPLSDFSLNQSSIEQVAVFGKGGTSGTSTIYIAEFSLLADEAIDRDSELEQDFVFVSSNDDVPTNLIVDDDNNSAVGNVIIGEWSTGTIISDTVYDGLDAINLTAGGSWGAVLAFQGDISDGSTIDNYDVDLAKYTNIKFKVASSGEFERYALSIVSNIDGEEASQEISFSLAEQDQWNQIDIDLGQYGVNLSNVSQLAVFGVYSGGSVSQNIYITDLIAYDTGKQAAQKPSSDEKFVILTSTSEQTDLRVDDNGLVNNGNLAFSDWSTNSVFDGSSIYSGKNAFEVTKGNGWGAVLALMGDVYGEVQTYEIDVAQYQTINFKIASTGGFSEFVVNFIVDGSEYKVPLTVSSSWSDISIETLTIPLNLTKLTQIAIYGIGGNEGNTFYVTDLNIAK